METNQLAFDEVKNMNLGYHSEHVFTQNDYEKCLEMKKAIEQSRDATTPKPGDIVEYTTEFGHYYSNAHVEKDNDGEFEICEQPYVPFMFIKANGEVGMSTSGGAWSTAKRSEFTFVGTRNKLFKDWGMSGACANGTIHINAVVNVWSINRRAKEWLEYTEKNYEMWLISDRGEPDLSTGYRYSEFSKGHAWKTPAEIKAFLERYHAVEEPYDVWPNSKKYWLFKKVYHWVYTKEAFNQIDAIEEKELFNGLMRPAKFITEGTTVHCYVDRSNEEGTVNFLKEILGELK